MNTYLNQDGKNEPQCCIDFCQASFDSNGQQIVNNYRCEQKEFATPDLWNIRRQKNAVSIGLEIHVH